MDFTVENHGTIFLLRPLTDAANDWVEEYLPDNAQRFSGALVVEHRYIRDIVEGIQRDGLKIG
jgi:hypothetical protein